MAHLHDLLFSMDISLYLFVRLYFIYSDCKWLCNVSYKDIDSKAYISVKANDFENCTEGVDSKRVVTFMVLAKINYDCLHSAEMHYN